MYHWRACDPPKGKKNLDPKPKSIVNSANRNTRKRESRKLIRIIERMYVSIRFYNFKNSANRKKQIVVDQSASVRLRTKRNEMKWMKKKKKKKCTRVKVHRKTARRRANRRQNERLCARCESNRTHFDRIFSSTSAPSSFVFFFYINFFFFFFIWFISHILLECAMDKIARDIIPTVSRTDNINRFEQTKIQ